MIFNLIFASVAGSLIGVLLGRYLRPRATHLELYKVYASKQTGDTVEKKSYEKLADYFLTKENKKNNKIPEKRKIKRYLKSN